MVDGTRMWGVALQNTLLTYFEIEPNSEFAMHSHENEQITMVLEDCCPWTEPDRNYQEVHSGIFPSIANEAYLP